MWKLVGLFISLLTNEITVNDIELPYQQLFVDGRGDITDEELKCTVSTTCCIGAISHGGDNGIQGGKCRIDHVDNNGYFQQRYPFNYKRRFAPKGPDTYAFTMNDVVTALPDTKITFIGDSVANQLFNAIVCDLGRYSGKRQHVRVNDTAGGSWLYGVKKKYTLDNIKYLREYRFKESSIEMACRDTDVLVFNYGVHWNDNTDYSKNMHKLARYIKRYCGHVTKVFRGSFAQHFITDDGYFTFDEQHANVNLTFTKDHKLYNAGCDPIKKPRDTSETRDGIALKVFSKHFNVSIAWDPHKHASDFYFIPVEETTKELYEFHKNECTHYCYAPYFSEIVTDALYDVLVSSTDRKEMPDQAKPPLVDYKQID